MSHRWHDAIRTLAKLHRIVPKDVGLEDYGRPAGFYDRQIKTWTTITKAQAETVDVETKEPVGQIPHIEDMLNFFRQKGNQPKDRGTPIHGDYKIDNLVFHKTEPRVIGILEYVLKTKYPTSPTSTNISIVGKCQRLATHSPISSIYSTRTSSETNQETKATTTSRNSKQEPHPVYQPNTTSSNGMAKSQAGMRLRIFPGDLHSIISDPRVSTKVSLPGTRSDKRVVRRRERMHS